MRNIIITTFVTAMVALAGCADQSSPGSNGTATTSSPAATTPTTTPSVTPTTTPTSPTAATPDGATPPVDCPEPRATDDAPGELMGYPHVVFTVEEPSDSDPCFQWIGPASVEAGWTAITLQNTGMAPHIMPMYRIEGDHDLDDVRAAFAGSGPADWLVAAGGVGFATPFSSGTSILNLQEGKYLIVCYFDGHHMQGMYRILEVTAATGEGAPEPTANATIEMDNFAFTVPENLTAGRHIVRFENVANQSHEAPLVALEGNATMEDFLAAIEGGQGPPPGAGIGGVNELAPGAHAYGIVDFAPGGYGLVCFVEDPASQAPHVALGMVAEFHVQ